MHFYNTNPFMDSSFPVGSIPRLLHKHYPLVCLLSVILVLCIISTMRVNLTPWKIRIKEHGTIVMNTTLPSTTLKSRNAPYLTYIISGVPERFNFTVTSLNTRLPGFFNIHRQRSVSLNDSRISSNMAKGAGSLLLTYIDLWKYLGSRPATELAEDDWIFLFEDDVDVVPMDIIERFYGKIYAQWNYSSPMHSIESLVQQGLKQAEKDGILYLGTCGPEYQDNDTTIRYSLDGLFQYRRGAYFCTHAVAYKKWRARTMWGDFASYMFVHSESGSDTIARQWQILSKNFPVSVASNIEWPPNTGHFGFFYQARGFVSPVLSG